MAVTAVFDTNILFSATGWRGSPFHCVESARAGEVQAVTCPELVEELAEKLELRLHFSSEMLAETLADYLGFLRLVQIPKVLNAVPRDPKDNMVIECAIEGRAQYIVSGDNVFPDWFLAVFSGIDMVGFRFAGWPIPQSQRD